MSAAESRRNARIRKILENSEVRLSKISGVEHKTTVTEFDGMNFGVIKNEEHNLNGFKNSIAQNHFDPLHDLDKPLADRLNRTIKKTELDNISCEQRNSIPKVETVQRSKISNVNSKYIYIFILALMQNLVLILLDFLKIDGISIYLGNIFLPLVAFDIYYYISHSKEIPNPSILNFLLGSYLNSNVTVYLKFCMCIFQITQDMMIYFFMFIVFYTSLMVFK